MSQRDREQMRLRIAQRAAQILIDSGSQDFYAAKHKAAQQLGAHDTHNLPRNSEIEVALLEYQRLFRAQRQPDHLNRLREVAVNAMQFLYQFRPRLVGSVLKGSADEHSVITLHLFAEHADEIGLFLMERRIPYQLIERKLKISADKYETYAVYQFVADSAPVDLVVFTTQQREIPLNPVDGKPMQRASLDEVEQLLAEELV